MSGEFDLEWFSGDLVGMTTRAGANGIHWNSVNAQHAYWTLLPFPTALDFGQSGASSI